MRIGVLALQGAFAEHMTMLARTGAEGFEIRQLRDIEKPFDGLILPGGESTVMGKLLHDLALFDPLRSLVKGGMPVFGTCAGLILLANTIVGESSAWLATMDITAHRNAYGRQLGSFRTKAEFAKLGEIPMTFIRAPLIESIRGDAEALAVVDGNIVAARQKRQLVTAFHPELDDDLTVYKYFLEIASS